MHIWLVESSMVTILRKANFPYYKGIILFKSEFHFLPHIYTFVTLITPSSENSSRISLLKSLDPRFLMRVHQVRCEVTPCIQKHVDGHKEWNRQTREAWTRSPMMPSDPYSFFYKSMTQHADPIDHKQTKCKTKVKPC